MLKLITKHSLHPMNNAFYSLPSKKVHKIISTHKKSLVVSEIHTNTEI